MLQKAKSKRIFQLKYLLLLPIILSMLIYSSCELGNNGQDDSNTIEILEAEYLDYLKLREEQLVDEQLNQTTTLERYNQLITERNRLLERTTETNPIIVNLDQQINALKSVIQDNGIDNSTMIFSLIDQAPVFPGCENKPDLGECFKEKMRQHVVAHFRYPQEAQEKGIQGKVYIYFVIDEIGNIADFRMRGPDASLEAEAERIIRLLPQMTPGKHKGNTVSVPFSMPISFKLQ